MRQATNSESEGLADAAILLREPIGSLESKPTYVSQSPIRRILFLDTDTYVFRYITPHG
jgi:hypothetical protein